MNNLDFIVFDLETGGLDPDHNEAISIAGKAYNCRTLEPYPADQGGEFDSLMCPLYPDRLQDEALKVNGITREQLFGNKDKGIPPAPDQKLVFQQFIAWVNRYNPKKSPFGAPIACGKNIRDFDMRFIVNLLKLHGAKKEKTLLFHKRTLVDLEDQMFAWFENEKEPANMKMDTLRDFFGLSKEGSHSAIVDTRQTGALIMKFLKLQRELQRRLAKDGTKFIKFANCMRS